MMTIHKVTAGDGYTYLTRHIAGGDVQRARGQDASDYYTANGNPVGYWIGRGAPLLDLAGQQVTEEQMRQLFGAGMHPNAQVIIAEYLAKHVTADMTDAQLARVRTEAIRAASLGNPFPQYEPLERFDRRVADRIAAIETQTGRSATDAEIRKIKTEEARRARTAVAGFDAVFAPVKSAALLWALDERPEARAAVREAHEAARDSALALLEQDAALTRTGRGGIAQIETNGLIAAVFEHRDSRAGDPNLHSHVVISSKVQGIDGKWRALDARALYRMTVAASEHYNTRFETELIGRLAERGYRAEFVERPDTIGTREPIREIAGVDPRFIEHFSSRRTQIEARYEQLLRQFRRDNGYDPSRAICHQLARQANLETRDGKGVVRSLEQMRADWKESITEAFGRRAVKQLMGSVTRRDATPQAVENAERGLNVEDAARRVVGNIEAARSTWTVWNVRAETERVVRLSDHAPDRVQHEELVTAIVIEAVSPRHSIKISAPELAPVPISLQRTNGESVFKEHAADRFTSARILAAEERLVSASRAQTVVGLSSASVVAALTSFQAKGTILDPGQAELVAAFATDSRLLVLGLGPAGSGKTTAMRAYAHVTAQNGQRVVPLATSAVAADVLGRDMGIPAENLHKFLWEYGPMGSQAQNLRAGKPVPAWARKFTLNPGDVVLVDEAGMAGTLALDELVDIAATRGAVVRLLGDYRQLGAVESGGALRLIANETGAVELSTLYRFHDAAEAAALAKVRVGDTTALDFYTSADRIRSGSRQAMTEAAYAGWKQDMLSGKTTLMAAATATNVTALAAQARIDRVEAGQVAAEGVLLHDGNIAGVGDWITTRKNNRELLISNGRDWVKNGDAWEVAKQHRDGSLTVRHMESAGKVRLPAGYVSQSVELLYATTTNRAQGTTVDTAHPLITSEMSRENLYVIASRARSKTTLYVATHELLPFDWDEWTDRVRSDARMYAAREILTEVLSREGNELSATETIRDVQECAESLATLGPRLQYAQEIAVRPAYKRLLHETFEAALATSIGESSTYAMLRRALLAAEQSGRNPAVALQEAAESAGLPLAGAQQKLPADTLSAAQASELADKLTAAITEQVSVQIEDGQRCTHPADSPLPPWLTVVNSAGQAIDEDMPSYLREQEHGIGNRIERLVERAITEQPAWLRVLGSDPEEPDAAVLWRRNVAIVAAYREQFAVNADDPKQVLGPHPDADSVAELAHRYAVRSVAEARRLVSNQLHRASAAAAIVPGDARAATTTIEDESRPEVRLGQPLEAALAERRRAAREAERAARRVGSDIEVRQTEGRDDRSRARRAKRQQVQEQSGSALLEPQPQRVQEHDPEIIIRGL
jgi:conjugative relaxase-like TrwC/TraI family protein